MKETNIQETSIQKPDIQKLDRVAPILSRMHITSVWLGLVLAALVYSFFSLSIYFWLPLLFITIALGVINYHYTKKTYTSIYAISQVELEAIEFATEIINSHSVKSNEIH